VEIQCQNLNWISVQSTGVVLLAPNFMNHLVKLLWFVSKMSHFRTFAPFTPSVEIHSFTSIFAGFVTQWTRFLLFIGLNLRVHATY
jgi:hypothetical protein